MVLYMSAGLAESAVRERQNRRPRKRRSGMED